MGLDKYEYNLSSSKNLIFFVIVSPPCLIHPGDTPVSSSIVVITFLVCLINFDSFTVDLNVFIIAAECHVVPHVSLSTEKGKLFEFYALF